ncbi:methionine--tRNA ligase mes1 [Saccharomyces pastorianus]|uniref:methionine--tRNA ligase n=1 Tax=Saccharomyces pastorianus TaxID=27292 RepID=A0A6C1E8W8_SACPS|nr:methionine--tRNA ligase mes1 [Saccharomyces pastorianus]
MSLQISFDKSKSHPAHLQLANNLKVALALEFASKGLKLEIDDENTSMELHHAKEQFTLFDANAILRYVMNDFEDQDSDKYQFALASLQNLLYHKELPQQHVEVLTNKAIENYLSQLKEPSTATDLIVFANIYALDPSLVQSKFPELPSKVSRAISLTQKHVPRDSSSFKNTGAVKIQSDLTVKPKDAEILPKPNERNILITSALPYVNNVPHLGNIIGSVLSADIFARYCKGRNYNALFICGTDEYGTATETKALEEGVTPRQLCNKYHKIHDEVYKWFQIGFDYFGRTTTDKQTEIAQDIFMKLDSNGYLEEQSMKQLYCPVHNSYLADRYVEGECPKCHYDDARGDQCDKCGTLLDPFELINPRCKLDDASPEPKFSDHIFLSLDKLESQISEWVGKASEDGNWSKNSKTITQSWLKDGLKPRCITRDLAWGTPVPVEKYKDKVLYVWFDATIGYVSITANYTKEWKQWWKNPENVSLYQFMGKDNVPFHTVVFPGSQLGTEENWTMLHHLNTTEYLQYENGKFSKSRGVGVFGNNAQDSGISPSVWRYYLASVRPESSDSHFSWDDFVARNNSELLANLGNFVNRLVKFVNAKYNGVVPEFDPKKVSNYDSLVKDINETLSSYIKEMELGHERRGLEIAMSLSARGNQFLQENKLDNTLFSQSPEKSDAVVAVGLNIIYAVSSIITPYMPEIGEKINKMLNAPALRIGDEFHLAILGGHNINKAEYLFQRIDEKKIDEWRAKYGGGQV